MRSTLGSPKDNEESRTQSPSDGDGEVEPRSTQGGVELVGRESNNGEGLQRNQVLPSDEAGPSDEDAESRNLYKSETYRNGEPVISSIEVGSEGTQQSSVLATAIVDPSLSLEASTNGGVFIAGDPPLQPRRQNALRRRVIRSARGFIGDYYMPLLLIAALVIGIGFSLPGKALGDVRLGENGLCLMASSTSSSGKICVWPTLSSLCVTAIFFITGITLNVERLKKALTAKKEVLIGLFQIFVLTSAVGFAIAAAPSKLNPPEFSFGLALFCLMPTTMSSCVLIVGYAGGNVALALLLTVLSNVLSVAILPFTVGWMIEVFHQGKGDTEVKINAAQLSLSLVFQVLVPLVAAGALRFVAGSPVAHFKERYGSSLKVTSAVLNAAIPWMRISQNSQNFSRASPSSYLTVLVCCIALHLLLLGLTVLTSTRFPKLKKIEDIKCVVFIGAQKTLPVALAVLELVPTSVTGDQGLVIVPLIFTYLFQAILDSTLAVKWRKRDSTRALSRPSSSRP